MLGEGSGAQLRDVPSGHIGVDTVHKGRIMPHFWGQRTKQMPNPLLVLHVDVKVANHDDAAISTNTLLAAAELGGLHVAFHDVDAIFLVKGDTGDFIKAHDV